MRKKDSLWLMVESSFYLCHPCCALPRKLEISLKLQSTNSKAKAFVRNHNSLMRSCAFHDGPWFICNTMWPKAHY